MVNGWNLEPCQIFFWIRPWTLTSDRVKKSEMDVSKNLERNKNPAVLNIIESIFLHQNEVDIYIKQWAMYNCDQNKYIFRQ